MTIKEKLILVGIDELEKSGIENFSLRHVAELSGVSCAAPYRHFKDKNAFIIAILEYINEKWAEIQDATIAQYPDDKRQQILEVCLAYVRFLVENPHFRAVILLIPKSANDEQVKTRHQLSESLKSLVHSCAVEQGMSEDDEYEKSFVVRSLLYGAAMFIDARTMEYNEQTMNMLRKLIERELYTIN